MAGATSTSAEGAAPQFDTVILGGHVIDPGAGVVGQFDVGIREGRIAAVEPSLASARAERVIDARGQIVTPGLIDLHTHVYWGVTYWGIEADPVAARSGVTTWLDVGSAGSYTFPGFRRYIVEPSRVRIYALLNLSAIGLVAPTWEFANLDYCDLELAAQIVERNRDLILGIKARIDRNTTRGVGVRPLELARELADGLGLPLMVHIGQGPPTIDEVAALLRPGDILTHCFTGGTMRILTEDGKVHPVIRELHDRGLVLDIGHGAGSFSFPVAEALLEQGLLPDVISSDIHQLAIQGPMFDLPTTLSKFLALGMSLPEVIERATVAPARVIGRQDLGTLKPGSLSDVALFRIEEGEYTFYDVEMTSRRGTKRLVNTLTLLGGEPLPLIPESERPVWAVLPEHQRPILQYR
ncbi:amidohydrolase/deacetylase family metallohydrolase [Thermomicrobiaceae bacterium CFH 74404]|uniref:Amidohydrolase/deacetylase family metallohydrolase n=1 Tax=Thermalbibacter longus TaxID=2951981 RepID=A0AA41WC93_9BACT|nr:amidohydrolase/deacetylase family metallohydrolase [Thermalbibacter longus]MCM8750499.1 amidohydrolase/deacetylase family metallohydrolase [Thermalbibacter longus]